MCFYLYVYIYIHVYVCMYGGTFRGLPAQMKVHLAILKPTSLAINLGASSVFVSFDSKGSPTVCPEYPAAKLLKFNGLR